MITDYCRACGRLDDLPGDGICYECRSDPENGVDDEDLDDDADE